ncbi:MAG TPA: amidohydrolase family protein [Puia sp.]|nr:amidohydrolase family protein [Puia sp.]
MILNNVRIYGENNAVNIFVDEKKISHIEDRNTKNNSNDKELQLHFENAMAFPGFINSHDHLEFNLFPQFGDRLFDNYLQWSNCTSAKYKTEINKVLQIPLQLRILWGMYKNLLCGVTTVVHHGEKITTDNAVIDVFQDYHFLHSVGLEKRWKYKLNKPSSKEKFVIHIGEGIDEYAHNEIDKLIRWNIFKKEIVAVHGVAMDQKQAKSFKALVWCPASNFFMLNETAKVDTLKNYLPIVFGTDSTLTANWNLWQHLRLAKKNSAVNDKELFNMLTETPAQVWGLKNHGAIKKDYVADIVIAENKNDSFSELNPENILLVFKDGEIKLFDEKLTVQLQQNNFNKNNFRSISINDSKKYVHGNLPELISEVKKYYPEAEFPVNV